MKNLTVVLVFLLAALNAAPMLAQSPKYPPLSEYMMTPEAEIGLARSAAPENVSAHATVKILQPPDTRLRPRATTALSAL